MARRKVAEGRDGKAAAKMPAKAPIAAPAKASGKTMGKGKAAGKAAGKVAAESSGVDRYPLPDLDSVPEDIRERILVVQEKSGFVPNVFLKLARRPAEFRAFFAYYDALMLKEGALTKAEREMIVVATSALNNCLYCVVAHGAILRIYQKDPLIADQLATNYRKAPLAPRQRAMLDFACKVAESSATISPEDHEMLRGHGFDDEAAWDIAAIAAFFALSNRIANFSGMMPNAEFYAMGRSNTPKIAEGSR